MLAKAKYSPVSNINNEYIDWDTFRMKKRVPYHDDVHGYRPTFHYDQNGNTVISSSDLYDFGKNYVGDFADLYAERSGNENDPAFTMELQRRALNSVGQPYLLVQKNIPIRYVDNPQGNEIWRIDNFRKEVLDPITDQDIARITGSGYIEPAIITAHKKGGNIHIKKKNRGKFTDYCGGKVTQECIEKGKKSPNPTIRKRATFADNARKWKHQSGGKLIPRCQEGVGEGGLLRQLGKAIYGLTLPKYEGTFSEAFRQARINGDKKFRWNGEHYNTELAPNATIEALKQWDTKGDLAREEFKNQALRNPKDFFDFYSKGYPTHFKNHNFDALYGAARFYDNYVEKGTNHKLGSVVYNNLSDGWDEDKIAAAMGNSYVETGGWTQLTQIGGPAKGLFMMEKPERERYQAWLHKNGYTDNHINQVNYVQHLFDSRSTSLKTPWDRLADHLPQVNEIRKKYNEAEFKDIGELQKFVQGITTLSDADKYGVRSAWGHQDYTTDQAWNDWNNGDLDKKTKAFEALFERAGKPNMDRRYYLAHLIKKNQNIFR